MYCKIISKRCLRALFIHQKIPKQRCFSIRKIECFVDMRSLEAVQKIFIRLARIEVTARSTGI